MAYQDITGTGEMSDLVVSIDWSDPTARVYFRARDGFEAGDEHLTPFQTADFDIGNPERLLQEVWTYSENVAW